MGKYFKHFEKMISVIVDIMLGLLVLLVLVVMAEAIYKIVVHVIPLHEVSDLSLLIEEIATLFILLEIILMLLRYVKEGHHIPVRYLILISITAILRELLLTQGMANDALLALAILVLIIVLQALEKLKAFHSSKGL